MSRQPTVIPPGSLGGVCTIEHKLGPRRQISGDVTLGVRLDFLQHRDSGTDLFRRAISTLKTIVFNESGGVNSFSSCTTVCTNIGLHNDVQHQCTSCGGKSEDCLSSPRCSGLQRRVCNWHWHGLGPPARQRAATLPCRFRLSMRSSIELRRSEAVSRAAPNERSYFDCQSDLFTEGDAV